MSDKKELVVTGKKFAILMFIFSILIGLCLFFAGILILYERLYFCRVEVDKVTGYEIVWKKNYKGINKVYHKHTGFIIVLASILIPLLFLCNLYLVKTYNIYSSLFGILYTL